jgi:hypothetical protein
VRRSAPKRNRLGEGPVMLQRSTPPAEGRRCRSPKRMEPRCRDRHKILSKHESAKSPVNAAKNRPFTMSPMYVANVLSPMPVASYIPGMARARHGSYLFKRPGSENWYVKLRSPTGRVEKSLGTSDYREADAKAGPLIAAHKAALQAARPRVETTWEREYEPGLHTGLNGERIYATPTELHYLDETPIRIEPNGVTVRRLIARGPLSAKQEFTMLDAAHSDASRRESANEKRRRRDLGHLSQPPQHRRTFSTRGRSDVGALQETDQQQAAQRRNPG